MTPVFRLEYFPHHIGLFSTERGVWKAICENSLYPLASYEDEYYSLPFFDKGDKHFKVKIFKGYYIYKEDIQ